MRRNGLVFFWACALVLCAGVVLGRLWAGMPVAATPPDKQPSWIADQLGLAPAQRQQMDAIWAETRQKITKAMDGHRAVDKERDEAIRKLLTPDQQAQYDQIQAEFHAQRAALDKERDKLIHDANDRSRALLDDAQKKKWDALTKDREMHEHHWPHGSASQRSATGPTTSAS